MKNILIFVKELDYGGIEKQVVTLSNSLVNLYDITLVFFNVDSVSPIYNVSKKIKTIALGKNSRLFSIKNNFSNKMKNILQNSVDIIISTDELFNKDIIRFSDTKSKKIFWCHNEIKNIKLLNYFDRLIFPTETLYEKDLNLKCDVSIIPNALDSIPPTIASGKDRLITVGKLTKVKALDDLIDVFLLVKNKKENTQLIIIGGGEERFYLEKIIKEKGLEKSISFLGILEKDKIIEELANSSIFVMTSKKETFGLSIIEAMSIGLPCVALDDNKQLKNIIKNDINGYLIKDRDKVQMAKKIIDILEDENLRFNLSNCAKETSLIYDIKSVKSEWLKLL